MAAVKYHSGKNVRQAAADRFDYLYDEFETVVVSVSGGKDSTVLLNMALESAERKNRLPIDVMFLDQEAEWMSVIHYMRHIKEDPRIKMYWLQVPMRISNAASIDEDWLQCWNPDQEDRWMRPKEPDSIHENYLGSHSFYELFKLFLIDIRGSGSGCSVNGIRCEESPGRRLGMTTQATYKWITWGFEGWVHEPTEWKKALAFAPLYDWTFTDVWKSIHDGNWEYADVYNLYYQHGVPIPNMRVSSFCHETAIRSLDLLHELEPENVVEAGRPPRRDERGPPPEALEHHAEEAASSLLHLARVPRLLGRESHH